MWINKIVLYIVIFFYSFWFLGLIVIDFRSYGLWLFLEWVIIKFGDSYIIMKDDYIIGEFFKYKNKL